MSEYVKRCNSVEDLASGRCLSVSLRTLRYSAKKLLRICRFLVVKGKQLSNTVFLKVSPIFRLPSKYLRVLRFLPALSDGVSSEVFR